MRTNLELRKCRLATSLAGALVAVLSIVTVPATPALATESVQLGFFHTLSDSAAELFIDDVSAGVSGPSSGVIVDVEEGIHTVSVRSVNPMLVVAHVNKSGDSPVITVVDAPIPTSSDPQCVSVFHSASAPAVDVFIDEELVRRNLKNGQLSPKLTIEEFDATIALAPSGSGIVAAGPLDFSIDANMCDIVAVTGDPSSSLEIEKVISFSLLPEKAWGDLLGKSEMVLLNATGEPIAADGAELQPETLEPLGGTVSKPMDAGRYNITFESDNDSTVGTASALGGASVTMAVHYDTEQSITTSAFVDDGQRLPVGRACIDVRHTAGAPGVDVYVDDVPISEAIESGQSTGRSQVKPGTRTVALTPAGSSSPVVEPVSISVREGQCVLVHLVGSVDVPDSLGVVALELTGIQGAPNAVPSGNSPLPSDPSISLSWLLKASG